MTTIDLPLAPPHPGTIDVSSTPGSAELTEVERRRTVAALGSAAILGIAGDLLLRVEPPGLNVLLWTVLGLTLLALLARARGRPLTVGAVGLGALTLVFAAAIAWRASPALLLLNVVALAATACALAAAVRHGPALPIESADLGMYVRGAAATAASVAIGAPALAHPLTNHLTTRGRQFSAACGVGVRGVALAAPALVVFGILLAAADGAFAAFARGLVAWDLSAPMSHVCVASALAWGTAGYLRRTLFSHRASTETRRRRWPLADRAPGAAEWCIALVLVDVLFVVFGIMQLGWLFGGRALVASSGVTYAEYARRGFFELVAVTALALPTALGAYGAGVRQLSFDRPDAARMLGALRVAAGTLLGCLGVVLVSAADRMRLYQDAYGLTELRLYTTAFMAWLAVVGICAATTVLRDRRAPFALGVLATAWLWVLALDVVNPAARIIAANVAHATVARPLDLSYAASLDADAIPALLAVVQRAPTPRGPAVCTVARRLDLMRHREDARDWRTWNVARWRAAQAIAQAERDGWLAAWRAECTPGTAPHTPVPLTSRTSSVPSR